MHLCALQAVGFEKNDAEGKLVLEGDSALPLLAATAAKLAKVRMALPACLVLCMVADANPPSVSLCFALSLSLCLSLSLSPSLSLFLSLLLVQAEETYRQMNPV